MNKKTHYLPGTQITRNFPSLDDNSSRYVNKIGDLEWHTCMMMLADASRRVRRLLMSNDVLWHTSGCQNVSISTQMPWHYSDAWQWHAGQLHLIGDEISLPFSANYIRLTSGSKNSSYKVKDRKTKRQHVSLLTFRLNNNRHNFSCAIYDDLRE
jgi:hypothetical protein